MSGRAFPLPISTRQLTRAAVFSAEIVIRERDIARVARNVQHLRIAMVEILVTLDHAWRMHAFQIPVRLRFFVGNDLFNIGQADGSVAIKKVCNQESRPDIS